MAVKQVQKLSEEENKLSFRIFNLAIKKVLKRAYLRLNAEDKKIFEDIFNSGSEEEKSVAIKNYIPDFIKLFEEEAEKIEKELKSGIEKSI